MLPTEPLPLHHSWPIFASGTRLPHGLLDIGYTAGPVVTGRFFCDLPTDALSWDAATFALYGLSTDVALRREMVLPLYRSDSRSALERLRAHAIRHHRGFTLDTEVELPGRIRRWLRIVAMPELRDGRAVVLHGLHQDVTHEYR